MASRLRRIRLRLARSFSFRRSRARRAQAHRRGRLPHVALLVQVVAAAALAIALQPGGSIRATQPWKWTPLPATAFGSLPMPAPISASTIEDERADERTPGTAPASRAAPAGVQGGGSPTTPPWPEADPAARDNPAVSTGDPSGASVTVRGDGPDAPSVTAVVRVEPTPEPAPKGPTHVVASGDNLWTIARRHAADLTSILRWNDDVDPDRLVAGQRILVPGGSKMKPLPKPAPAKPPASVRSSSADRPAAPLAEAGDHIWPLEIRGDLTRRFSSAHPGIDIAAPQGTRVRAIAGGTVVWSGWRDNGGGYVVEILHPNGMRSTYNHNSKLTVERGDKVDQGDTIALVGSTGWSSGPHLDVRIKMGGRLVDPLDLF